MRVPISALTVGMMVAAANQCSRLKPHSIKRACTPGDDGALLFWVVEGKSVKAGSDIGCGG
jgi:hypothetical protein